MFGAELDAIEADHLALLGDVAQQVEDEATDRVPLGVGQLDAELLAHVVDGRTPPHAQGAVVETFDRRLFDVVLVGDLAHDLLEQVLQRDQARGAAVLVDHDRHVELLGAHLAEQLRHPLLLGHEDRRADRHPDGVGAFAGAGPAHEVLQVDEADDVVGRVVFADGQPREPALDGVLDRVLDRVVGVDRDHVGARQHHLAHDGVTELEDRVDQPTFLAFDGVLAGRDVGHRAEVLLGDEGTLLQAPTGEDDVGDPDEQARQPTQRREVGEEPQHRGERERGALGVLHRERLRRDLADHEEQDDLQHDAEDDTDGSRGALQQHADERGGGELRDQHHEQHDVERLLGVFQHHDQSVRALVALFLERDGPDAAHADERGLRRGEEDRQDEQEDDGDDDRPVGPAHADRLQPSSCRKRSSSSRSRRCIDSASRSSAWS